MGRQGKLFLVSTTTDTSMTTTTSVLTTSSVCLYPHTDLAIAACAATGRKKRAVVKDPLSEDEFEAVIPSAAETAKTNIASGVEAETASNRKARFFLYYMTTTSTSTSTSYTGTYSITLVSCPPTTVGSYCGR